MHVVPRPPSGPDPARILADGIAGHEVVVLVADAARHAVAAYDELRRFVESDHGQALAAYWRAFDAVEDRADWLLDASIAVAADVDAVLYAVAGLLYRLGEHYPEGPNPGGDELEELLARLRADDPARTLAAVVSVEEGSDDV